MTNPESHDAKAHRLLQAAQAETERGDVHRADALFREYLALTRNDPVALGNYGLFCMRTGRIANACYLFYKANALESGDAELLNFLGYAQLDLADYPSARRSFDAALKLAPSLVPARYGLGLCLRHEGEWTEAVAALELSLAAKPDTLQVLLDLAEALQHVGEDGKARTHFERAAGLAPADPRMLFAYAQFLRKQGDAMRAMTLIDRLLLQHPENPAAILEKARCLRTLGDGLTAIHWLKRVEKVSADSPDFHAEIVECLPSEQDSLLREEHQLIAVDRWIKAQEFAPAEAMLDRLLASNPASVAGWNLRGILENARHRLDDAETAYRKAIAIDPSKLDASANLAQLYETTNRVADAWAVGENALRFIRAGEQPIASIDLLLALCKTARRRKDLVGALELIDRIEPLGPNDLQRQFACFERGRTLDLLDDPRAAFAAFVRGNALALAPWLLANPGRNKGIAGVEYLIDLVDKGWLREWESTGASPESTRLAFLVGFPRSGTTLLNQVLDTHPAIQAMEEKPPASKIRDAVQSMPAGFPLAIPDLDALDIDYLREAYFRSAAEHGAGDRSKLILDKFPMQIVQAALLHRVFPQARFVFALRHPCDVVLSCFMQNFRLNPSMANFCTLADTVALYVKTMDLWQLYREQLPLAVHTIRYEDVVDDFDGQVRALCGFLDVPWQDSLRDFSSKALERGRINTPSYEQVSRPIYREARYRWERYREFLEPFLPALRPWIERFGYSVDASPASGRTS